ncbi:MAG: ATP-binding protein [Pseudomonadales bacterium]|nr:ATP-binding protein [Pseudomonadales bacterium]
MAFNMRDPLEEQLLNKTQALQSLNQWVTDPSDPDRKIQTFLDLLSSALNASYAIFVSNRPLKMLESDQTLFHNQIDGLEQAVIIGLCSTPIASHSALEKLEDVAVLHSIDALKQHKITAVWSRPITSHGQLQGGIRLAWANEQKPNLFDAETLLETFFTSFASYIKLEHMIDELKVANCRFRRSQVYANIGTWDWDLTNNELYWTERIAPLFGYPVGELETSFENFMNSVHPGDRTLVQTAVDECINYDTLYDLDHRVVWPDGTVHWVNEKGAVERDNDGNPVRMLGVVQDIQRAKEAEDKLLAARIEAERANRSKSEFLSLMSHELRTPLNSMLGFAQLLQFDELTEDQNLYVDEILNGGQILLQLVNDVLDFAKIDTGNVSMETTTINVHELIKQCINLLSLKASERQVNIDHACDGNHPLVRGDFLRLKQVIINLLSNAIKYNRVGGKVTISCELKNNGMLRVSIIDTGHGISEDKISEVFKPFSRLGFENSAVEGVGIGLLISKQLINAMQGDIGFNSTLGIGSTFWIEIPSDTGDSDPSLKKGCVNKPHLKAKKVLYIEDNRSNRLLVQKILISQHDAIFVAAETGDQGIALAKHERPDIILLDINLPDINGIEVRKQLMDSDITKSIPVIALTADAAFSEKDLVREKHFYAVIYKPFIIEDVIDTLNAAILYPQLN